MTTFEFRSNVDFVRRIREILADPVLQLWLGAMDTENPVRKVAPPDVSPHGAYIMLGEQTGYNQYKENFLLGAEGLATRPGDGPQDYSKPADQEE